MNIQNKQPIFVPEDYREWMEKTFTKAALMDLIWDYEASFGGTDGAIVERISARGAIVLLHRKQAKGVNSHADQSPN